LLDVPAILGVHELELGRAITAAELQACCDRQGVAIAPGDVVLVRTGNGRYWSDPERYLAGPGMDAGAARWLAEQRVLAVGADNMAWDVIGLADPEFGELPGHLILLARGGIYIIENLRLEELAAATSYRFSFICTPLKFVGATGSPVRPIALVAPTP
jgi:kynurenine formamidase